MGKLNNTSCPWRSCRPGAAAIGSIEKSLSQMGDLACSRNLDLRRLPKRGGQDPCLGIWSLCVWRSIGPCGDSWKHATASGACLPSVLGLARQACRFQFPSFSMDDSIHSDVHRPTAAQYRMTGSARGMTL
jgi:hypothetical protein